MQPIWTFKPPLVENWLHAGGRTFDRLSDSVVMENAPLSAFVAIVVNLETPVAQPELLI
jgi:hypothetical protein